MKRLVRRLVLGIFAVFALSYGGMVAWLLANETRMVFQPTAYGGREQVAVMDSLGLDLTPVRIGSGPGVSLAAWVIRADSSGPWLLFCHGNAGNITLAKRQRFYRDAARSGFNMLAFDYRGFGSSSDSTPSEAGVYADARAAYRYLRDTLGVATDRIVIYGHSLGGGVATELATTEPAAGLILEGTFTSVPAVGSERYPFLPIDALASNRFDNAAKIGRLAMPLLILHARADGTIPFPHGERLFAAAPEPKRLVPLGGDHDSAWEADHDRYMEAFAGFVNRVVPRPTPTHTSDQ
ncbi:MAG: alpha/beta hydrolase [Gemmatimonadales bacterium]